MARSFRLGGLLRLRKLQEEQAAAELARANAEKRKAEKRRQDTEDMLAGTMLPHRSDELSWRAAIAARAALTGLAGEAGVAVDLAGQRADASAAAWSGARTRATTLEKLEERHVQTEWAEEIRAEQLVLDEAASRGAHRTSTSSTTEEER